MERAKFMNRYDNRRISHYIPTLYMPYNMGSSKTLIYFHANAEDIVLAKELLDYIRVLLRVNVLAVEYPGYGIYTEEHQKRYNYPVGATMHLKKKFTDIDQKAKTVNYAKEARIKRNSAASNAKTSNDITGDDSLYGGGYNCRVGDEKINADSLYDPYEPYNQNVFESCEDNILDDSEYVFDYLT